MANLVTKMIKANELSEKEITYNVYGIDVGYIVKQVKSTNGDIEQIIDSKPRLFKYRALGCYQDIESGNYYQALNMGEEVDNNYYIPKNKLTSITVACAETLQAKNIKRDARLTIAELREIVDAQNMLKEIYFN